MASSNGPARFDVLKKWWFWICCGILGFFILFILLLPVAAKYGLSRWLLDHGADRADIDRIRYNPFLSRISLEGLVAGSGGQTLLRDGRMRVDFALSKLLHRDIHVEDARYHDLMINLEQKNSGAWRIGTYTLESGENEKAKPGKKRPAQEPGAATWIFSARNIALANCKIHLKTPELDVTLAIKEAALTNFSTGKNAPCQFDLSGTLNGKAIEVHLASFKVLPDLALSGRVKVDSFDLAIIRKFVAQALPVFGGKVSLAGSGSFVLTAGATMSAQYDGSIIAEEPLIGDSSFGADARFLQWKGKVVYKDSPEKAGIFTRGVLSSAALHLKVPEAGLVASNQGLVLDGACSIPIRPQFRVDQNGTLTMDEFTVNVHDTDVQEEHFGWQGKVSYALQDGKPLMELSGRLESGLLAARQDEYRVAVETLRIDTVSGRIGSQLSINGLRLKDFKAEIPGEMPLSLAAGSMDVDSIDTMDLAAWRLATFTAAGVSGQSLINGAHLIDLGNLEIRGVGATSQGEVTASSVELSGLQFLGRNEHDPVAQVRRLLTKSLAYDKNGGIVAESLHLSDLDLNLLRTKKGEFNIATMLAAMKQRSAEKNGAQKTARHDDRPDSSQGGLPLRLNSLVVDGRNDIGFVDQTLPIDYVTNLVISSFRMLHIDSTAPEKKTTIEFQGEMEGRAPVVLRGDIAPFTRRPDAEIELHVKNYPLSRLSPYTIKAVGTALASGELRLDSRLKLQNDYLNLYNKAFLQQLETKTIAPELAAQLNNQLPMPLDAALAILRDGKGNISLKIPLTGPLANLNVGVTSIIISTLGKAIIPAASSYLVYALGPYGALAYVGVKVGEKLLQIRLPSVPFTAGEVIIDANQFDYLARVAKILKERPETDLQLVPKAVASELTRENDRQVTTDVRATQEPPETGKRIKKEANQLDAAMIGELEKLGQLRAQAIRKYLQEKYDIDAGRLLISETQVEKNTKEKPEVLLGL